MLVDVSHQSYDHHRVDGQDVAHPAVQHPVLQDVPVAGEDTKQLSESLDGREASTRSW